LREDGKSSIIFSTNEDNTEYLIFSIFNMYFNLDRLFASVFCYDVKNKTLSKNYYYTSKSELGMWRYCTYRLYTHLNKGYNYVSTTAINLELQKQFNILKDGFNFDNLDEELDDCLDIIRYNLVEGSYVLDIMPEENRKLLYERIEGIKYISQEPFFLFVNSYLQLVHFYIYFKSGINEHLINSFIEDYVKNPENNENIKNNLNLNCNMDILFKFMHLKKDFITYLESSKKIISRNVFYETTKNYLNNLFEKIFTYESPKFLFRDKRQITSDFDDYTINIAYYRRKIKSTHTDEEYFLYYMYYFYNDKYYNNIIQIVPIKNKLLPFGLEQMYAVAGIFINKPFDYSSQIHRTKGPSDKPEKEVFYGGNNYTFIGNYNNYQFLDLNLEKIDNTFSLLDLIPSTKIERKDKDDINETRKRDTSNICLILLNPKGNKILMKEDYTFDKIKLTKDELKLSKIRKIQNYFKGITSKELPPSLNLKGYEGFSQIYIAEVLFMVGIIEEKSYDKFKWITFKELNESKNALSIRFIKSLIDVILKNVLEF
jgi:hypothetical protein